MSGIHEPIAIFNSWFSEVLACEHIKEKYAVCLATSTPKGVPSNRIVLVKTFDDNGFIFYTNCSSRKGQELTDNPYASLCYFWDLLDKQVRVEGKIERVSQEVAAEYFNSRDINSRIGAWASKQSQPLASSEKFMQEFDSYSEKFGTNPPKPDFWHGFRLIPEKIEFWSRGDFRLHRRELFIKKDKSWEKALLYP
jgi:pyridoxamine 5'-phosphate oxidase